MTSIDVTRQAAEKMLDLLSAMDLETQRIAPTAVATVMKELADIEAVRLITHPLTGAPVAIDASPLVHGVYFLLRDLVADVVEATDADPLHVIANLRTRLSDSQ